MKHDRTAGREAAGSVAIADWWLPPPNVSPSVRVPFQPTDQELTLSARVDRHTRLGHFRIPQVPRIALEAMALLARPDAEPADVSALIHRDQQLAADVIAFANSALFAGATRVTNIPEAILRVGTRRTRSLIFAASLRAVVYSGCELAFAEQLWRHACGCALISAQIAKNIGRDADDFYLAGLFHDVGKTVVLSLVDAIALRSQQKSLRPAFVEHMLETHHERVGTEVAIHWDLPDEVVDVIQHHRDTDEVPLSMAQAIVGLANNACHRLSVGAIDDGRPIAGSMIRRVLRLSDHDLPRILHGVPEVVSKV